MAGWGVRGWGGEEWSTRHGWLRAMVDKPPPHLPSLFSFPCAPPSSAPPLPLSEAVPALSSLSPSEEAAEGS